MRVFPITKRTRRDFGVLFFTGVAFVTACFATRNAPEDAQPIIVAGRVIGQDYDYVDKEVFLTRLTIKMRFTNISHRHLILYKQPTLDVGQFAVDSEALASGTFVYQDRPRHLYASDVQIPRLTDKPSAKHFLVLSPGHSFERTLRYGVVTRCNAEQNSASSIQRGRFAARFLVDLWPFPKDARQIKKFEEKWSSYGIWLMSAIPSDPIPVLISDRAGAKQCRSNPK